MVRLNIDDERVIELVRQLPLDRKREVMRELGRDLADSLSTTLPQREARFRAAAKARGHNWDEMSEQQRTDFVDDLIHEGRH